MNEKGERKVDSWETGAWGFSGLPHVDTGIFSCDEHGLHADLLMCCSHAAWRRLSDGALVLSSAQLGHLQWRSPDPPSPSLGWAQASMVPNAFEMSPLCRQV